MILFLTFILLLLLELASPSVNIDNLNVDDIISNRRLLIPYIKCALDKGKCTSEAKDLKKRITDALTLDCKICTNQQKDKSKKVFQHMIIHEKDYWRQIVAKFDPEHKVASKYEKEFDL
ncbi:hypothetical protein ACJJTC_003204 [Scirpophaga incertulas]